MCNVIVTFIDTCLGELWDFKKWRCMLTSLSYWLSPPVQIQKDLLRLFRVYTIWSVSFCNARLVGLYALRLYVIFIFYVDFALVLTSITVLKHWRQMMIFIKYQYMSNVFTCTLIIMFAVVIQKSLFFIYNVCAYV